MKQTDNPETIETKLNSSFYCPYIGFLNDPGSLTAYPSILNSCHRCQPKTIPDLGYQGKYCLSKKHIECSVFSGSDNQQLPIGFSSESADKSFKTGANGRSSTNWAKKSVLSILIILIVLAGFFIFNKMAGSSNLAAGQLIKTQTLTVIPTAVVRITKPPVKKLPTRTKTPPRATPTKRPTLAPAVSLPMDTPLGTDRKFLIHRLVREQSLTLLAKQNNTSEAAILAITYGLFVPVWVGKMIVVPINQTDVSGLPALEPYKNTQPGITLAELALKVGMTFEDLERFNGCGTCRITAGSWLLIIPTP